MNGNGYVPWKAFITILISVLVLVSSVGGIILTIHSQSPHKDSVSKREIDKLEMRIIQEIVMMQNDLKELDRKYQQILMEVKVLPRLNSKVKFEGEIL